MALRYNPKTSEFFVATGNKEKAESTGLTMSTVTTGPNGEPVYYTDSAYAALNFYKEGDDSAKTRLTPIWHDYEMSWATTSPNTYPMGGDIVLRGYQNAAIDYALSKTHVLIGDAPGIGKEAPLYTKILTPTGWTTMGAIKPGDSVVGRDGGKHTVIGVYPQGMKPSYRITFGDGTSTECGLNHLWSVGSALRKRRSSLPGRNEYTTKTLQELIEGGLQIARKDGRKGLKWYVPLVEPVQHAAIDLPIDPYVLGVLIGDGCLAGQSVRWSTPDFDGDIVDNMRARLTGFTIARNDASDCPQYRIMSGGRGCRNKLKLKLEALGLRVKSGAKFIPTIYKVASISQRLELLRGLMDTDGTAHDNRVCFCTSSPELARDVADIVRSLGGTAKLALYNRAAEGKSSEWRVRINLKVCPFLSVRKSAHWWPTKYTLDHKYIEKIEYVGDVEQQCIMVDAADHLYVTDDYTVTHNTLTAIGICNTEQALKVLVICPSSGGLLPEQWKREIKRGSLIDKVRVSVVKRSSDGIASWAHYVVMSYDLARNPGIHAALCAVEWDAIILDEAHMLKETTARRTQAIFGGGRREEFKDPIADHTKRMIALTGTPLPNRPRECFTLTQALCHEAIDYMTFEDFRFRYNPSGITATGWRREEQGRLPELHARLRCNFMVRRLKEDVLKDLPAKTYELTYIEADGKIADIVRREKMLNYSIDDLKKPDIELLGQISTIRREMGEAKVPQTIAHMEYLMDIVEIPKVVMFSNHRSVMDSLRDGLSKYGVVEIRGGMTSNQRIKALERFINDPKVRILSGQIEAAGVGLDGLQKVCSHVVIVEPAWTSGSNEQAVDRIHRSEQHANVIVQFIVVEGSLDEYILATVIGKTHVVHETLDNRKRR